MKVKGRWPLRGPSHSTRGILGAASVAVLGVMALACGTGSAPSGSSSNLVACERYAEHLNSLAPCIGLTYDPDNWCQGADQLPVDMSTYYDCLRQNAACEGEVARIAVDQCTPPVIQLAHDPALGSEQGASGGDPSGGRVSGDGVSGGEEE